MDDGWVWGQKVQGREELCEVRDWRQKDLIRWLFLDTVNKAARFSCSCWGEFVRTLERNASHWLFGWVVKRVRFCGGKKSVPRGLITGPQKSTRHIVEEEGGWSWWKDLVQERNGQHIHLWKEVAWRFLSPGVDYHHTNTSRMFPAQRVAWRHFLVRFPKQWLCSFDDARSKKDNLWMKLSARIKEGFFFCFIFSPCPFL